MWQLKRKRTGRTGGTLPKPPAERLGPAEWARAVLGFPADSLQARVLETQSKRGILNCTRQWGKSTVTAAKAVHQAFHEAGSLTLVVSPCARQSGEFIRKTAALAAKAGIRTKVETGDRRDVPRFLLRFSAHFPHSSFIMAGFAGVVAMGRNAGQKAGGKPEGLPHGDGTFPRFP
jgi:hypothetical protein